MAGFYNTCYCLTGRKRFYSGGIARHRRGHIERGEACEIRYSSGQIRTHAPEATPIGGRHEADK